MIGRIVSAKNNQELEVIMWEILGSLNGKEIKQEDIVTIIKNDPNVNDYTLIKKHSDTLFKKFNSLRDMLVKEKNYEETDLIVFTTLLTCAAIYKVHEDILLKDLQIGLKEIKDKINSYITSLEKELDFAKTKTEEEKILESVREKDSQIKSNKEKIHLIESENEILLYQQLNNKNDKEDLEKQLEIENKKKVALIEAYVVQSMREEQLHKLKNVVVKDIGATISREKKELFRLQAKQTLEIKNEEEKIHNMQGIDLKLYKEFAPKSGLDSLIEEELGKIHERAITLDFNLEEIKDEKECIDVSHEILAQNIIKLSWKLDELEYESKKLNAKSEELKLEVEQLTQENAKLAKEEEELNEKYKQLEALRSQKEQQMHILKGIAGFECIKSPANLQEATSDFLNFISNEINQLNEDVKNDHLIPIEMRQDIIEHLMKIIQEKDLAEPLNKNETGGRLIKEIKQLTTKNDSRSWIFSFFYYPFSPRNVEKQQPSAERGSWFGYS